MSGVGSFVGSGQESEYQGSKRWSAAGMKGEVQQQRHVCM